MPSVARVLHQGLAADKPAADAALNQGWLYYETDTDELKQSWNGVWVMINAGGGVSALTKIDEQVVGVGGAPSITFSAISGAYAMLRAEVMGATDTDASGSGFSLSRLLLEINGDATAAHYRAETEWTGTPVSGPPDNGPGTSQSAPLVLGMLADPRSTVANLPGRNSIEIGDYANAAFGKVGRFWSAVSPATYELGQFYGSFTWNQTAAITSLVFTPSQGLFAEGTTARLYGIS